MDILEQQVTMPEIKNTLYGLKSIMEMARKKI